MIDDWTDPLDPANPLHSDFWAGWVCPGCSEDGERSELDAGSRCPHCGERVEALG